MPNIDEAIEALLAYQQADMEGVMVLTSRQAIHEVADELKRVRSHAQCDAAQPVAWRVKNDHGHWYMTSHKDLADTWRDFEGYEVQDLYVGPAPSALTPAEGEDAFDFAASALAAQKICDCMDNNLAKFEAYGDCEVPQAAKELYETAKKLRDMLAPHRKPHSSTVLPPTETGK